MTPNWKHYPQTWYAIAIAHQLKPKQILSGQLGGLHYVVYRSETGSLKAADAFCPHMGAHLKGGKVVQEAIACGLHGCHIIPQNQNAAAPPVTQAVQQGCCIATRAWHVIERFGLVWLYPPTPEAPSIPPFNMVDESAHIWAHTSRLISADWRAMICNGFDISHMQTVHQRQIVGEPQFFRLPDGDNRPQGFYMDYQSRVLEHGGWSSAVIQKLSGGTLKLRHTCIGTAVMVESTVGAFQTIGIFATLPQDMPNTPPEQRQTRAFAAIAIPKTAPYARAQLFAARMLYLAFLRKDFTVVEHMRMRLDAVEDIGVRTVSAFQHELPAIQPESET